mmetsp:Transcript_5163/g.13150  ORF Transcript_5163/g.13150 Transcript_5163/m.13150 type:complete len:87 (-) Transcript_5163:5082-5342(-)
MRSEEKSFAQSPGDTVSTEVVKWRRNRTKELFHSTMLEAYTQGIIACPVAVERGNIDIDRLQKPLAITKIRRNFWKARRVFSSNLQ